MIEARYESKPFAGYVNMKRLLNNNIVIYREMDIPYTFILDRIVDVAKTRDELGQLRRAIWMCPEKPDKIPE